MDDLFLHVISGSKVGRKVKVEDRVGLGRSPENTLAFTGPDSGLVSGRHAEVEKVAGELVLRDLGSRNGTFVNGVRVTEHRLAPNEVVSLGQNGPKLRVQMGGTETFLRGTPLTPGLRYDKGTVGFGDSKAIPAGTPTRQEMPAVASSNVPAASAAPASSPPFGSDAGSYTLGLAQRIVEDEAGSDEIKELMRDSRRVKRLVASGALGKRDARMIGHAAETYSSSRKRARWVAGGIASLSLVIIVVLVVQIMGYRKRLAEQENLFATIEELEAKLARTEMEADPSGAPLDEDKKLVVAKLRAAERQLMNLRTHLRSKDHINAYANPLGREIHEILEGFGKQNYVVPDIFISQVEKHIRTFTRPPVKRHIENALRRKGLYYDLIQRELLNAGMPLAFFYLAVHESGLDSAIVSSAGARGLWQFMPATGREYGMQVPADWRTAPIHHDQRTNPAMATRAAIRYLKKLYAEFGDVALAMAAYNAGEGRIRGALRRIDDPVNNRDFWYIYRMGYLAAETNEYVPKIIATIIIDKNRQRYGFPP